MSERGFTIMTLKNRKSIDCHLSENSGFTWNCPGKKPVKISKSTRNYMQAETKAKKLFREMAREELRRGNLKETYSSMWFEPNLKIFDQKDFDRWLAEGSY